jgi:hypothetical protein
MKSLILGIVAVFSLQIGFVALTTSDNAREAAVKDIASTSGSDPLFGLIAEKETAPDLSTPIFVDHIVGSEPPATRSPRSRPMTTTRRFSETAEGPNPLQASTSKEEIIILYGRGPNTIDPVVAAVDAKEKPRTESRSLLANEKPRTPTEKPRTKSLMAKAAPIIQKPYNWLKAVASKLK